MNVKRYSNCNSYGRPVSQATHRFCARCNLVRRINGAQAAPVRECFNKQEGK